MMYFDENDLIGLTDFTSTKLVRRAVFEGQLRPALRNSNFGVEYHLCLYIGAKSFDYVDWGGSVDSGGNFLMPSRGKLQVARQDGSLLSEDEWYSICVEPRSQAETNSEEPLVVIQGGAGPAQTEMPDDSWLPPACPPSYRVHFESADGEPLQAKYVGELVGDLSFGEFSVDLIFVSEDLGFLFTLKEVERYSNPPVGSASIPPEAVVPPKSAPEALQDTILNALQEMGYDPQRLPPWEPGTAWSPKTDLANWMNKNMPGIGDRKLRTAWQTLRETKKIREMP